MQAQGNIVIVYPRTTHNFRRLSENWGRDHQCDRTTTKPSDRKSDYKIQTGRISGL
ncbi:hypothetical protein SPLC1_S411330 [Arthrospira platensis C1]|nr:hypothetical protein SPLC1_S411330 [Arthrospira platensis C1]